jgi:hypothetical protein
MQMKNAIPVAALCYLYQRQNSHACMSVVMSAADCVTSQELMIAPSTVVIPNTAYLPPAALTLLRAHIE